MSSLIVEVCRVEGIEPHPNADKMMIAKIKGWFVCIGYDPATKTPQFQVGDRVVYFPPDSVLIPEVSDRLNVTKYLAQLPKSEEGTLRGARVKSASLRGFKSYGFVAKPDDPTWEIGTDVAAHYQVTKYEPPLRANQGDAETGHPAFHKYFDMENIRHFPTLIEEGEEVVATEKIHGQNCRLGLIREANDAGQLVWRWAAGSHEVRRKRFWQKRDPETRELTGPFIESDMWRCFNPEVRNLLAAISECGYTPEELDKEPPAGDLGREVVIFGERFGSGVQDMTYGLDNGQTQFRAFDISINGNYLDFDLRKALFEEHGVAMVPVVYRGPYSFLMMTELAEGPTEVTDAPTKHAFREGVVVFTAKERPAIHERRVFSRAQVKCISFAYLNRKEGTEYH